MRVFAPRCSGCMQQWQTASARTAGDQGLGKKRDQRSFRGLGVGSTETGTVRMISSNSCFHSCLNPIKVHCSTTREDVYSPALSQGPPWLEGKAP